MKYSAIIPCGGIGSRLNLGYNKILYQVGDTYLIEKTIQNFLIDEDCLEVIIVYQKNDLNALKSIVSNQKVKFTLGGNTREESVLNGLKIANSEFVLIHDGARPNLTKSLINRIKEKLENSIAVIPTVKCKDATLINGKYHRDEILLVQTPQGFKRETLYAIMQKENIDNFRDEGSIIEFYLKIKPELVEGDYNNIKVTTKEDLKYIMED